MPFTRTSSIRLIKISSGLIVILLITGYITFGSLDYARGPSITVTEPADWATISASTTPITGHVERVNSITLNGRPIFVDEQGIFSETIIVFPGTNIITIEAHDQFGRTVRHQLRLTRMN